MGREFCKFKKFRKSKDRQCKGSQLRNFELLQLMLNAHCAKQKLNQLCTVIGNHMDHANLSKRGNFFHFSCLLWFCTHAQSLTS